MKKICIGFFAIITGLAFASEGTLAVPGNNDEILTLTEYAEKSVTEKLSDNYSIQSRGNMDYYQYPWSYGPVGVKPVSELQFSMHYKTNEGFPPGKAFVIIFFTDQKGKPIGQVRIAGLLPTTQWRSIRKNFVVPDEAVKMRIRMRFAKVPKSAIMFCDKVSVRIAPKDEKSGIARQIQPPRGNKPLLSYSVPQGLSDYGKLRGNLLDATKEHPWLAEQKNRILKNAQYWLTIPDEQLWLEMPGQSVSRVTWPNREKGCPDCGPAINRNYGYYHWLTDPVNKPWKTACPKCKQWFPKNDFMKYYLSGIDENGAFNPEKADSSLLFNEDHPDPKDPEHRKYVDAGDGWVDEHGDRYMFIGTYNLHAAWGRRLYPDGGLLHGYSTGALDLAYAWLFTGDQRYARKAAIILSRMSLLYPDMDYLYWTSYSKLYAYRNPGKILNCIWENFLINKFLKAYGMVAPMIKDDPELASFLAARKKHLRLPEGADKGNLFLETMEYNYLKEIFSNINNGIIRGNVGMCEESAALLPLVTWDVKFRDAVTNWLFAPAQTVGYNTDYHITSGAGITGIVFKLTRDGFSMESGGYCDIGPNALFSIYSILKQYSWIDNKSGAYDRIMKLCRERLMKYYYNSYRLLTLDMHKPSWGDNGTFCRPYYLNGVNPSMYLNGYLLLGEELIGRACKTVLNLPNAKPLFWDELFFFDEEVSKRLGTFSNLKPLDSIDESFNASGRGLVLMKSGKKRDGNDYRRALFAHYGENCYWHNNIDTLGLQLFAYGRIVLPHLGYPDLTQVKMYRDWYHSGIANNLVVVDRQKNDLNTILVADQKIFAESPLASICDVDAIGAYPSLSRYRRLFALVNISDEDFYVVDFFEVKGGKEHVYSFHSGDGNVISNSRLKFTAQGKGTYAGADVNFGAKTEYEGPRKEMHRWGNGFSWLYDVKRSGPVGNASFLWELNNTHDISPFGDKVRLNLSLLTPIDEIALAKGKPPQNIKGNPEGIPYLLAKNESKNGNLTSDFVAVIECFLKDKRPVKSVRLLKKISGDEFSSAIKVTFNNGKSDIIIRQPEINSHAAYKGEIAMRGRFAILRLDEKGKVSEIMTTGVSDVSCGDFKKQLTAEITGKVVDFSKDVSDDQRIVADKKIALPGNGYLPMWIRVSKSQDDINAFYPVKAILTGEKGSEISTGSGSYIRNNSEKNIFSENAVQGFEYELQEGQHFQIVLSYHMKYSE